MKGSSFIMNGPLRETVPGGITLVATADPGFNFARWQVYDSTMMPIPRPVMLPPDIETNPELTLAGDQPWRVEAVFTYKVLPEACEGGKIQYSMNPAAVKVYDVTAMDSHVPPTGYVDMPAEGIDVRPGQMFFIQAVPNTGYNFDKWTFEAAYGMTDNPLRSAYSGSSDPYSLGNGGAFKIVSLPLTVSAAFSQGATGFSHYTVKGVERGANLLEENTDSDGYKDGPWSSYRTDRLFYSHLPYGTPLEDRNAAIWNQSFTVSYKTLNADDEVWFRGSLTQEYVKLGTGGGTHTITPADYSVKAAPMPMWEYRVNTKGFVVEAEKEEKLMKIDMEIREAIQSNDTAALAAMGVSEIEDSLEMEALGVHFYYFRAVPEFDPGLTYDVPVGGHVVGIGYDAADGKRIPFPPKFYLPASTETQAVEAVSGPTPIYLGGQVKEEQFGQGTETSYYDFRTPVTVEAVPDGGYSFGGWTVGEGYAPVMGEGNRGMIMMANDATVKPIFIKDPSTHKRHKTTAAVTPAAVLQEEPVPLGAVIKQLFIGYPVGDLRMFGCLSRGELSVVVQRALAYDVSNPAPVVVADPLENWYRNEALMAIGNGYMPLNGMSQFRGNDLVTADELTSALSKAFGKDVTLQSANGITQEQVAKILKSTANDFSTVMDTQIPLGAPSAGDQPVTRNFVARLIYGLLYPVEAEK